MPDISSLGSSGSTREPANPTAQARHAKNSQAIADAKTAKDQAQARVDQDERNHSPSCVAVDQKGVDKAQSQLASANAASNQLSLVV